jgi:hypothetical protein
MSESGEKSLYEESLEEGAKAINKKTGKPIEEILEEAEKENIEKHAQARGVRFRKMLSRNQKITGPELLEV